jgi:F-type H+-transporting ATPase subunit epsilon
VVGQESGMSTFHFELVSPERQLFEGPVESVTVPASEGDMTILPNHAPVMTTLRAGVVAVWDGKGTVAQRMFVHGGFADVNAGGLTILAEVALPVEEIKADEVAEQMREAEEQLRDATSDEARAYATEKLDGLREMMALVRN